MINGMEKRKTKIRMPDIRYLRIEDGRKRSEVRDRKSEDVGCRIKDKGFRNSGLANHAIRGRRRRISPLVGVTSMIKPKRKEEIIMYFPFST
jgi:hypothetical protein